MVTDRKSLVLQKAQWITKYPVLVLSVDVFGKIDPENGNEDLFKRRKNPIASTHGLSGRFTL